MNYLQNLATAFFLGIPSVIAAILLLLLAIIVANIAKKIAVKFLIKIRADKYTDKLGIRDEKTGSSLEFLGKLVFTIVFLLFLPGVLDRLGMQNVSTPISEMISKFLNFVPNILAAVIIIVVGIFVANIIRQLLTSVLKRLNVDRIQERAGIVSPDNATISSVLSYIVYVVILIPVIIAALEVLNISAISNPAIAMLNKIALFLPNIIVAIAIVILGVFIAKIAGKLLTSILSSVGTDTFAQKWVPNENSKLKYFHLSRFIGETVKYIIILLFVVEAVNVVKLEVLQFVGTAIISYLPFVISAIIIMIAALMLAAWVEKLILMNFPQAKITAISTKFVIIAVAVFMMLNQLGIAATIVNAAFIIILSALAVAFAIAFGVGGREFAKNVLKKAEEKIGQETEKEIIDIE